MKLGGVFDIVGGIILLAIIATLAAKPQIIGIATSGLANDIKAAKG